MHGGVTGKAGDSLPMSIPLLASERSIRNGKHRRKNSIDAGRTISDYRMTVRLTVCLASKFIERPLAGAALDDPIRIDLLSGQRRYCVQLLGRNQLRLLLK
jgi:hypothetical protein